MHLFRDITFFTVYAIQVIYRSPPISLRQLKLQATYADTARTYSDYSGPRAA